ncbi:hypothetical protein E2I00_010588 [Balaenoptera physalus]|uniref:Uncharacterized protein n=1 Tax=Balaenoptera physalus TaxID=9770 RepID=A0A6A1Q3K7_BALPH|nr:hypothetical protein E2I00_010588 [Balaenoptera physalus]
MAIIQVWQRGERVKRRVRDGRDSTGAAGALRPHKHAAAPGRARASVKDILEVSYGCNKLLGPAPMAPLQLLKLEIPRAPWPPLPMGQKGMLGDMERTQLKDSKALNFERKGHELAFVS